ncbi:MAG: hypothetical protein COW18_13365 [Zetaproteobacteria bacterium CG12_big_fil_rev_8_21_14_0_65_54_13]|nr:MAG: hypothetical protein COW18_13365 [Zetaproteobacteria bacterium CG12_big_fil_rev_8_21_14_0_65_54_13]PIX54585.1 MAG: hypothetical protein COZ50_07195 [Zetaproteobacteria bacterium CG_4_10_14_3_um_filter_54_28]PJA27674.1 MAG: hypothetical protein CO188_11820 [Zetaproteobacteria bacterium CG_4_9_14_3_um_filter_54_145]
MSNKLNPREVGKSTRECLYDKILLSWELEYSSVTFDVRLGCFKEFCTTHSIVVEQGSNPKDFDRKVNIMRRSGHLMYFVYRRVHDSKAKSLFYFLRNAAAHADFGRKKPGRKNFVCFQHIYNGKVKMMGQIPESLFSQFVDALASTKKA